MFSCLRQRHIYGHQRKDIKIFADDSSLAVNPFNVRSWLDLLSQTPRVAPFLSKGEPLIMALKKVSISYSPHLCLVSVDHIIMISKMRLPLGRN